jgi:16S rRNA (guanine(966)-N(2))-methyltransferase RsmD
MKIIAGKYRGRNLAFPKSLSIRPTKARVKEAVFSSIQNEIIDSVFIDLFAGTGAIGIEALSREAKKVYFIDNNSEAISLIKKNVGIFDAENNYEIIEGDYKRIKTFAENSVDIIYIDPPYENLNHAKIIRKIIEYKILKDGGLLIIERNKAVSFENLLTIEKTKKYGKSFIDFCRISL